MLFLWESLGLVFPRDGDLSSSRLPVMFQREQGPSPLKGLGPLGTTPVKKILNRIPFPLQGFQQFQSAFRLFDDPGNLLALFTPILDFL